MNTERSPLYVTASMPPSVRVLLACWRWWAEYGYAPRVSDLAGVLELDIQALSSVIRRASDYPENPGYIWQMGGYVYCLPVEQRRGLRHYLDRVQQSA